MEQHYRRYWGDPELNTRQITLDFLSQRGTYQEQLALRQLSECLSGNGGIEPWAQEILSSFSLIGENGEISAATREVMTQWNPETLGDNGQGKFTDF